VAERVGDELVDDEGEGKALALIEAADVSLEADLDAALRVPRVAQPLCELLGDLAGRHAAVVLAAQRLVDEEEGAQALFEAGERLAGGAAGGGSAPC
jgi:seryl-tRNA(Sec) selenium transferase